MRKPWLGPVLIVAMVIFSVAAYPFLPERIPSHWNWRGEVDGWMSRGWGAAMAPLMAAAIWGLLRLLPKVDPRRASYERFQDTYWLFLNTVVLFLAVIQVLELGYALGWPVDMGRGILLVVGLVFVVIGNYLPRIRSNWWMGVRTPWTLDSERVWRETHRLAGRTFVLGGVVTALAAALPEDVRPWVAIGGLVLGGFIPAIYSYVFWRREQRERQA